MLKILTFLSAILLTSQVEGGAISLDCVAPPGFESRGHRVEVTASGVWETLEFGHSRLNYQLQYGLDCNEEAACWATAKGSAAGVLAYRDYRPTRYQGFAKYVLSAEPGQEGRILLLPEQTPDSASPFTAYLQLNGVHGSYGTTVPLRCQGQPILSHRSPASEQAVEELARSNHIIQEDFGFPGLRLQADVIDLQKTIDAAKGQLSLSAATALAMAEIFDEFAALESPLNIIAEGWLQNQAQKEQARRLLRAQMLNDKTTLTLYLGKRAKGANYPPEQGESERDNWIFVLHIPTLSDHLYWIIIDRYGKVEPYLYGFN